jgi:hypothetical protein
VLDLMTPEGGDVSDIGAQEYWCGEYRHAKLGDAEYPVQDELDAWFNGTFVEIEKLPRNRE